MSKKRKNSNYVTSKNTQKQEQAERQRKRESLKKKLVPIAIATVVLVILGVFFVGLGLGWFDTYPEFENDNPQIDNTQNDAFEATHHATIAVKGYGTIHLELYGNEAPETVENFVSLAESGFYDGLTFHRIMSDFMAQGGDPEGDGTGDSGKTIKGEFSENGIENNIKHVRGTISMARGGYDMDSASCQFFIVHKTSAGNTYSLDGKYAAFGMVTSGMNVIDKICYDAEPTDGNGTIEADEQPIIESITIHASH